MKSISSMIRFCGEFLASPGSVGALMPSGRALSRRMANLVPARPQGHVVELGSGTGSITTALLNKGIPMNQLVSIDSSPNMVSMLRKRYPELTVLNGSAARLQSLLSEHIDLDQQGVSHVVSGLPLKSLPRNEVDYIIREVRYILPPGGRFIQFTYDLRQEAHPALSAFELEASFLVWPNIPPARVHVYQLTEAGSLEIPKPVPRAPVVEINYAEPVLAGE